ncbi:MAG: glutathione S-transferase family protein [Roseovarius sp.]
MYEVIGTRASRAMRVLWMLEEAALEYTHVPAKPRDADAIAANASGKVPALRDGDAVITDSVAIMTYLADKHGILSAPAATVARAQQDAMTLQIIDDVDALLWAAARHSFILPEERRVPGLKDAMKWEYERNLARIAAAMQGPFLMGEHISLPDILLGHCLGWARMAKFPDPGDVLSDYHGRLRDRAAYKRAAALP